MRAPDDGGKGLHPRAESAMLTSLVWAVLADAHRGWVAPTFSDILIGLGELGRPIVDGQHLAAILDELIAAGRLIRLATPGEPDRYEVVP